MFINQIERILLSFPELKAKVFFKFKPISKSPGFLVAQSAFKDRFPFLYPPFTES